MQNVKSFLSPTRLLIALALISLAVTPGCSSSSSSTETSSIWIGTWGSAQYLADGENALPADAKSKVTLRQIVRISAGGSTLRLRISNAFGTEPLRISALHIARPIEHASSRIDPATDRAVTFSARPGVIIPAGAELTSDAVSFVAEPLSRIAVSMHLETVPTQQTGHPASHTTSYVSTDSPPTALELETATAADRWWFLSSIDVLARDGYSIVTLGDSITDGSGSTTNGNDRWPDMLAERLQRSSAHHNVGVINAGIGGNRLLLDGKGPNALARFDRDVLARSNVRYLIVLEGINDLGMLTRDGAVPESHHEELVRRMIQAYGEMIARARTHGIEVIGATIMPFGGFEYYHPNEMNERDRQAVNAWIRSPENFDAVVDFDEATANPDQPDRLRAEYDSGDHIHPSPAGFRAMGEAIPLELFAPK